VLDALRLDDPELRAAAAIRLCSDLRLPERDFIRENGAWVLRLPPGLRLARLEYQLEVLDADGNARVVCDPANPERAPGAFGEKSVLTAPGYRRPAWLETDAAPAHFDELGLRVLGRELAIRVWSPAAGALRLLVAHDGPEYDELAALSRYAGAMIARDAVPPRAGRAAGRCALRAGANEHDLWGYDVAHDWPWWRAQFAHHLPRFC
jgi:hypothetical protein